MERKTEQRRIGVPDMAASKRFSRYKSEGEKAVRKADLTGSEVMSRLIGVWNGYLIGERCQVLPFYSGPEDFDNKDYEKALALIRNLEYSPEDVERFSISLAGFQDERGFSEKAGLFLSALINECPGGDFMIHAQALHYPLSNLGRFNTKDIRTVQNPRLVWNGYSYVGYGASGGTILIEGVVNGIGKVMKGGRIIVNGSASGLIGNGMNGGIIEVYGEMDPRICEVAEGMTGGEIHFFGNTSQSVEEALEGPIHGKIFAGGKLIVDK